MSDGQDVIECVVTTRQQSPFATPNPDRLAALVEHLLSHHGGPLRAALDALASSGTGIDLDTPHGLPPAFR